MFREKIPERQLSAWIFAAMVPVGIQLLSGSSWIWVACGGALSVATSALLWRADRESRKWESIFLFIYVVILLGQLLGFTAQSWPMGNSDPAVPLILLGLAAVSAAKGTSAAARVGAVLFWVVLGVYIIVFAAGARDIKVKWLIPEEALNTMGLTVFLIPWAARGVLKAPKNPGKKIWLAPMFILAATVMTAGVLSPMVAAQMSNAFYEMSRSLNLLDVARRFEALICAGAAVGWFAVFGLFLTLCGTYAQKIFPGKDKTGVWVAAAAAAAEKLCGLHINPWILLMAGTVFWVAVPLLTQGLEKIKKS